ncbi:MAG: hypothetical protein IJ650_07220 [Paludibacteraceae bacterium]|nr:hypothetical protein [Paludibacteraceae bacterium]
MKQEIALFRNFGLATPSSVTYSPELNAFITAAFQTMSGNCYFSAMRLSEGILIKEDIGQGGIYNRTFLNGVHIYDLKTKTLLCEYIYPMYEGAIYSRSVVATVARRILKELVEKTAQRENFYIEASHVDRVIYQIVNNAVYADQTQELNRQIKSLNY